MKVDRSTKVILMLIAIGLFLNAADKFSVDPVIAGEEINDSSDLGRWQVFSSKTLDTDLYRVDIKTGDTWVSGTKKKMHWQKIEEPHGPGVWGGVEK